MGKPIIVKIGSIFTENSLIRDLVGYIHILLESSAEKMKYAKYRKRYDIHPAFKFFGYGTVIVGEGQFIGKEGSHLNSHCYIAVPKNCCVVIGKNCHIGHYVTIYAGNIDTSSYDPQNIKVLAGDVIIENNCYIATHTIIPKSVRIGKNSIIGAGSIVTKNIPSYSLAAGSPARVIRSLKS